MTLARDVDTIIEFIKTQKYIPPVHRQVMVNRLQNAPSTEELEAAKAQVYPEIKNPDPWKDVDG